MIARAQDEYGIAEYEADAFVPPCKYLHTHIKHPNETT